MDIRKQRSMTFIWQSFFQLMIEGNFFSQITINQICEKAMVHRSTFYKHFEDKYALLEFGLSQLFADYLQLPATQKAQEPFTWANSFFDHSDAQRLLEAQKKDDIFFDLLKTYSITMMKMDAITALKEQSESAIPLDLLAEFHVSTIFTLSSWQAKHPEVSNQEMDAYFRQLAIETITSTHLDA